MDDRLNIKKFWSMVINRDFVQKMLLAMEKEGEPMSFVDQQVDFLTTKKLLPPKKLLPSKTVLLWL